ncbi:MAG: protease inhibitor I42 family protein [Clostridia bacterium]|nr:protease inhibitor I42 family protein [Clostridia bacterium]
MKKYLLLMSLLVFITITDCGRLNPSDREDPSKPSNEMTISLKENPTTGYVWSYTIEPEDIVKIIKNDYSCDNPNLEGFFLLIFDDGWKVLSMVF